MRIGWLGTMSLKTQTMVLMVLLVMLATGPLVWYYLQTTAGLTELGADPRIERALAAAVESADSPARQREAVEALRNAGQVNALRGRIVRQVLAFSIVYSIVVVLVSLAAGYFFVNRITRPLKRLTEAAGRIGGGGEQRALEGQGAGGEVARLVAAFNAMIGNLETARRQLAAAERRAAWQHAARTIAHEIKNPLTPIKLSTERLYDKYLNQSADFPEVIRSTTATILAEIANLQKLVDTFHRYARFPDPVAAPESIDAIIAEVVGLFAAQPVPLVTSCAAPTPLLLIDKGQVREALANLVKNGIEAVETAGRGGEVRVSSRVKGTAVEVTVEDNGCGISAQDQKRLFQPYFTTKAHGSGIGLALTERIVSLNGGRIEVESEQGRGTRAVIVFETTAERRAPEGGR